MEFKKYQHIERFGTSEVEGIELGKCYLFSKIDGSCASVWMDDHGNICAGSRKRQLSLDSDNAGFYQWVLQQDNIKRLLNDYPDLRLFGEWLVPHSLKTYRDDAWRNFYVFDVMDNEFNYLPYFKYKDLLDEFYIEYIPPMAIIKNGTYESFCRYLDRNDYLIKDGKGKGEGIVIKNYEYRNKYGRQTWAKIVSSEFKEKHFRTMGAPESKGKDLVEEAIANKYVTKALCEKVKAKIELESGWSSKFIPRLLNTVYHDVITEESWNFVKEHKNPTINFKTLSHFVTAKIKEQMPDIF